MPRVEMPNEHMQAQHQRTRFLAAAGLGTDHAAVEFYRSLDDEGREEVAGMVAESRQRVAKLKERNAARLAKAEETAEG